ncbi:hypothetical protein [Natronorubrum sulfidifaciens]|uniref:Uncharacterized protein n=1 Tax=Natronorubrum sulfidifaciens JCM 14089 TaxID=1230460 RepID=L9VW11_9EURY|nr:hypothetical protein [Natronorubrum sulfidifaciens]ELY41177.1 hypothetical protein C495_16810 [Natronorubrum sulfidifaciens JCM 14089]
MVDLPEDEYEERVERARLAREEARETINEQTQTISDIDEKAIQIFRINIVVASILMTGLSIAVSNDLASVSTLITPYTATGSVLLFLSIILAAITYTSTSERVGINKDTIEDSILNQKYDYDLVEEEISKAYGNMIRYNFKKNVSNVLLFTFTLLAAVVAISYMAIGIIDLYDSIHPCINILMLGFVLVFGKFSGLYGTTNRWRKMTDPRGRFQEWGQKWRNRIVTWVRFRSDNSE